MVLLFVFVLLTGSWPALRFLLCKVLLGAAALLYALPRLVGLTVAYPLSRALKEALRSDRVLQQLLSVVKRVQVSALGKALSNPLPPIAKLEDMLLSDTLSTDTAPAAFVCKEVRAELHCALLCVPGLHAWQAVAGAKGGDKFDARQ